MCWLALEGTPSQTGWSEIFTSFSLSLLHFHYHSPTAYSFITCSSGKSYKGNDWSHRHWNKLDMGLNLNLMLDVLYEESIQLDEFSISLTFEWDLCVYVCICVHVCVHTLSSFIWYLSSIHLFISPSIYYLSIFYLSVCDVYLPSYLSSVFSGFYLYMR